MTVSLEVRGLVKRFGRFLALNDVSFDLRRGEVLAIIGPNGAGKSTCFNVLNGQLKPDSGTILLGGEAIAGKAPQQIAKFGVGRTFQIARTFASMTVLENVATAMMLHDGLDTRLWPVKAAVYRDSGLGLLTRLALDAQAERPCGLLAYGDLKRVDLAMALAQNPTLLLMDEPTAGMAPNERAELMRLTTDIALRDGIAVLFTEHDMDVVFGHAGRVIVLDQGQVIASGSPAEVRGNRRVQQVYLGLDDEALGGVHGAA